MSVSKNISTQIRVSAGVIAVTFAALLTALPANAATSFSSSGYPGSYAFWRTPAYCYLEDVAGGRAPELNTDAPVVAASQWYASAQRIERRTRIEWSGDGGRTWSIWQYLPMQSGTAPAGGGVAFLPQKVDLYPGLSYRVVEGFDFFVGASSVGSRWYVLDRGDYRFLQNPWGTRGQPTATYYSAGCSIPSLS
jgi:hypothetical protein